MKIAMIAKEEKFVNKIYQQLLNIHKTGKVSLIEEDVKDGDIFVCSRRIPEKDGWIIEYDVDPDKEDALLLDYAGNIDKHHPDGDLFNPEIKAWNDKKSGGIIKAICPQCNTENEFSARKNEDGFGIDANGYYIDLDGNKIQSEYGPIPSHYGRRCFGLELRKGEHQRCSYRWTFKSCEKCNAENDIAARYCAECKAELIDPNEKLIADFKSMKRDPYQIQTDRVLSWEKRKTLAKSGAECLVIDYVTEYRKVSIWLQPRGGHQFLIKQFEAFMKATNGGEVMPQTITYRKENSGFYRALAYNQEPDIEPQIQRIA